MNKLMNISLSFMLVMFAIIPICWVVDNASVSDDDEAQEEYVDQSYSFEVE